MVFGPKKPFGANAYAVDGKNVAGTYTDSSGGIHGFVYNGSSYTTYNVPGADFFIPFSISGDIVAGYYIDEFQNDHGFVYNMSVVPEPNALSLAIIAVLLLTGYMYRHRRGRAGKTEIGSGI
jgi:uncharacterized membrane protein YdcZ (DUF606 family)